jgi:plasmid maintenance system antidote protein VapI
LNRGPAEPLARRQSAQSGHGSAPALRLAKFFGTTPEFWANMQSGYDLKMEAIAKRAELAAIDAMVAA